MIPPAPGAGLVNLLTGIVALVLCFGCWGLYRIGLAQLALAEQQADFVSAVSHELKTPLTSIRMYGEMLREGWVDSDEKKKKYYDFIFFESERLSRLIANVLQLSRVGRGLEPPKLEKRSVSEIFTLVCQKTEAQVQAADFKLLSSIAENCTDKVILIDEDSFLQIFINLIDNAVKFSRDSAEEKAVRLDCRLQSSGVASVVFSVRDFGSGISKEHMRSIFKLFYRAENELTRKTKGTGIGLSLVQQLAAQMNSKVDVRNADPGTEFSIAVPLQ